MTRARKTLTATATALAALVLFLTATLPPAPVPLDVASWTPGFEVPAVAGAIHVHTDRSDGGGSIEQVAAAAARAGLAFVVFADHGNATRAPEAPTYHSGVLCLDGVEISTQGGHYVALDMPAAPYPLGGEARDVVADVARFGGFGIVSHPTSRKRALEWTDWAAPFDGLEWLNADSEWRDEDWRTLWRLPFDYLVRPTPAIVALLDRPHLALVRWDALTPRRPVVAIGAQDAHARLGPDAESPYDDLDLLDLPSYEATFRAFAVRLELDRPLSGDAAADAQAVFGAIRRGRLFTAIDALASPVRFEFWATSGTAAARMGETLIPDGVVALHVRTLLPAGGEVALLQDGQTVRTGTTGALDHAASVEAAVFRVEVHLPWAAGSPPVPWIVSNPIYVGQRVGEGVAIPPRLPVLQTRPLYTDERDTVGKWEVEFDPESRAAVNVLPNVGGLELAFRYALRGAPVASQYAALVRRLESNLAGYDRLTFQGRASRPMRVEVQVRQPDAGPGQRWERSVYLDEAPREVSVFFDDMRPIGRTEAFRPDLALVDSILFVVDTNHTAPATAGVVWLDDVTVGRR